MRRNARKQEWLRLISGATTPQELVAACRAFHYNRSKMQEPARKDHYMTYTEGYMGYFASVIKKKMEHSHYPAEVSGIFWPYDKETLYPVSYDFESKRGRAKRPIEFMTILGIVCDNIEMDYKVTLQVRDNNVTLVDTTEYFRKWWIDKIKTCNVDVRSAIAGREEAWRLTRKSR